MSKKTNKAVTLINILFLINIVLLFRVDKLGYLSYRQDYLYNIPIYNIWTESVAVSVFLLSYLAYIILNIIYAFFNIKNKKLFITYLLPSITLIVSDIAYYF